MVQRGVTANAGRPLRPRYKEIKDMKLFEDIVSEEVSEKFSDHGRLFLSVGTQGRREGK